jgi:tRNA-Thr(GGU) m(6)t(6)A37 methyltransferase TsaA
MTEQQTKTYQIFPIGYVRREDGSIYLDVLESYVPALKQLEHFSHVQVLWWFSEFEDDVYRTITEAEPPYEAPVTGIFACRSPVRPNPIGLTIAEILSVDHGTGEIEIVNMDAFDGTPVIDLKPYIPVTDRVKDVRVPEWIADWPEWMPEEGHGLEE